LQLRERSAVLDQSIAEFDVQLNALVAPPGGNNFVQQQRNVLSQQRNLLVAEHNQVVNQLNTLQEQQNQDQGQDQKLQLNAEVAQRREKYMQAIVDLRKSVDELTAKYDGLSKNPEITKALDAFRVDQEQAEAGPVGEDPGRHQAARKGRGFGPERDHRAAPREWRLPRLRQSRQSPHENDLRHGSQPHDHLGQARQSNRVEAQDR